MITNMIVSEVSEKSAAFTHLHLSTGRGYVKPPTSDKKELTYKCSEVQSLKLNVNDMRNIMKEEVGIRKKILQRQMILQYIYLN